jgi:hypothetical protein
MWDGFTAVLQSYAPVIYEGPEQAIVVTLNTGPAVVRLHSWDNPHPDAKSSPLVDLELRPGDIRTVSGRLVRAELHAQPAQPPFAAVGWRFLGSSNIPSSPSP